MHKSIRILLVVTLAVSMLSFSAAATVGTVNPTHCERSSGTVAPDCGDDGGGSCCVKPALDGFDSYSVSGSSGPTAV